MKSRHLRLLAIIGILSAVTTGCAAGRRSPAPSALDTLTQAANLPGRPGCFWKSSFQGDWTVLNDSTLIVHAPMARDAYVVKLFVPVFGLGFKEALGFADRTHSGQICNNEDAWLEVPDREMPKAPIVAVHALSPAEEDQLLRAAGKPLPHRKPDTRGVAPTG